MDAGIWVLLLMTIVSLVAVGADSRHVGRRVR